MAGYFAVSSATQPEKDNLSRLYRDIIMQHAQAPIGFRKAIRETHRNEQFNPLCGDRVLLMLEMDGEIVADAAFDGESCVICKASASLLCKQAPGQLMGELKKTHHWLELALQGDEIPPRCEALLPLLGVRRYPSRIQCALLPWEALAKVD
jgi:nitrogen fixation NifU-like protein